MLGSIRRIGERVAEVAFPDADAVHLDFHHRNVLVFAGRVAAIVDCEGMPGGDRAFDLATLFFCLEVAHCDRALERRLLRELRALRTPDIVRAYIAHQALRQVDWSIRRRNDTDVSRWLRRSLLLLDATS